MGDDVGISRCVRLQFVRDSPRTKETGHVIHCNHKPILYVRHQPPARKMIIENCVAVRAQQYVVVDRQASILHVRRFLYLYWVGTSARSTRAYARVSGLLCIK